MCVTPLLPHTGYNALESRHSVEPTDHVALLDSDSNINYKSTQPTSDLFAQQNNLDKDSPKLACNDYTTDLHNPYAYATTLESHSNLEKSFTYNYASELEHSEVSTNVEEIYLDPGHSEADIYACFEKQKVHIIINKDVRCAYGNNVIMMSSVVPMVSVCTYVIIHEYAYAF